MRRVPVLALVLAASCARCGAQKSAASAEELLPQRPSGAVVTAPLGALAEHLKALADTLAALPGGEQLGDLRKGLAAQLGFDPLTREGLVGGGVDPQRGAALVLIDTPPRPEWIVALPLANAELFVQTVQKQLVERGGFTPAAQQPATAAKVFERGSSAQKLGLAVVRGYGMLARGADPAALLLERKVEESLARAPGLAAAKQKLGAQDVLVWAPAGSALPRRYTSRALPGDVALSLQGAPRGLALKFVAELPPAQAAQAGSALPGGGAALAELLPDDAPVRARLGVAPARLLELARGDAQVAALLDKLHGVDEVFAALQPGAVLSLSVAKNASIAQAIDYGLDFRRKSPFDTVELVALAQVADRARLIKALDALAQQLPALGMKVSRTGAGASVDANFETTYAAGQGARFGVRDVDGKPVGYVIGGAVKPGDLHRSPKSADAPALYEDAGAAARADFGKLAAAIHALPESTFGTGPQSYVTRSVVGQVIDPLRPLRLSFALQAQPDSLNATLDVEVAAP